MDLERFNQDDTKKETSQVVGKALFLVGMFLLIFIAVSVWGEPSLQTAVAEIEIVQQTGVVQQTDVAAEKSATALLPEGKTIEVSLPQTYALNVSYGDLGPQLLAAGAIDYDRFVQLYQQSGRPLSPTQLNLLKEGSEAPIVMGFQNAHFLLNFFWALGLANNNPILTEGPMMQYGAENIGRFASTGGWSIGQRPATALYASTPMIPLTPEQQARLEAVAYNVYRPCCNNHTAFPDCNHGMAMLGLLELLASQDATVEEMFTAAKYVNGFWFPQQTLETAVLFKAAMNLDYEDVDARLAVGPEVFSASGYQQVNQWLAENNLLELSPNGGNSCGVG